MRLKFNLRKLWTAFNRVVKPGHEKAQGMSFDEALTAARVMADGYGNRLGDCLFADDGGSDGFVWMMGFIVVERPDNWFWHTIVTPSKSSMIAMNHRPPQEQLPALRFASKPAAKPQPPQNWRPA